MVDLRLVGWAEGGVEVAGVHGRVSHGVGAMRSGAGRKLVKGRKVGKTGRNVGWRRVERRGHGRLHRRR